MITFDRLKLISTIDSIEILDETAFIQKYDNGVLISKKYTIYTPYKLSIDIRDLTHEVIIEFSGKILGNDYPKLISIDTIDECFNHINAIGIVKIDVEAMMNAQVVSCDVTKDIRVFDIGVSDFKALTNYIITHLSNSKRYSCKQPPNGNLIIENNAMGKTHKTLTIYNKGKEMNNLKKNRNYMEQYNLTDEFDNVCRLEMKFNNKEHIQQALQIADTSLASVLTSSANPIADFLASAVTPTPDYVSDLDPEDDLIATAMLYYFDNDMAKLEANIRAVTPSRGTSIKRKMRRYRQKYESMQSGNTSTLYTDLLNQLN